VAMFRGSDKAFVFLERLYKSFLLNSLVPAKLNLRWYACIFWRRRRLLLRIVEHTNSDEDKQLLNVNCSYMYFKFLNCTYTR
jgi:hypothetical protein